LDVTDGPGQESQARGAFPVARPFSQGLVRRFGRRDRDEDMGLAYPRAVSGGEARQDAARRGKTRQDEEDEN